MSHLSHEALSDVGFLSCHFIRYWSRGKTWDKKGNKEKRLQPNSPLLEHGLDLVT